MKTSHDSQVQLARAVLGDIVAPTATVPGYIVFAVPGSNYQLHLRPDGAVSTQPGKRLIGTIRVQARRVDVTHSGGKYVEPVVGRPRRIQGTVMATDATTNSLTINAGGAVAVDGLPLPVVAKLTDGRQKAEQFQVGQLVTFDVLDGATFTPAV